MSSRWELTEFQRKWARPDAAQWGELYSELVPALPRGERELPEGPGGRAQGQAMIACFSMSGDR